MDWYFIAAVITGIALGIFGTLLVKYDVLYENHRLRLVIKVQEDMICDIRTGLIDIRRMADRLNDATQDNNI